MYCDLLQESTTVPITKTLEPSKPTPKSKTEKKAAKDKKTDKKQLKKEAPVCSHSLPARAYVHPTHYFILYYRLAFG